MFLLLSSLNFIGFLRYLSFNNFKGEIPVELANLPELRYLYLHENRFTGRIPPELGTLKNLRHL
jgi:Leucine-rich repeat (LRR) protein